MTSTLLILSIYHKTPSTKETKKELGNEYKTKVRPIQTLQWKGCIIVTTFTPKENYGLFDTGRK